MVPRRLVNVGGNKILSRRPKGSWYTNTHEKTYLNMSIPRPLKYVGGSYMPMSFQTRFVYDQTNKQMLVGALGYIEQVYRGNSIYDPDFTGAGTTVNGHAEMGTIYTRYRVIGSKITVKATPVTISSGYATVVLWADRDSAAIGAGGQLAVEHVPNSARVNVTHATGDEKVVSGYANSGTMYAMRSADDFGLGSAWSDNPASPWFWRVAVTGSDQDVVKLDVCIEYYTICYYPVKTYPSSL